MKCFGGHFGKAACEPPGIEPRVSTRADVRAGFEPAARGAVWLVRVLFGVFSLSTYAPCYAGGLGDRLLFEKNPDFSSENT